jgi:Bacterial TSP3 repeat
LDWFRVHGPIVGGSAWCVKYIIAKNKPPGDPDAITTNDVDNVIFDHITSSWGIDSNHDLRRGKFFTVQWSIYAECLNHSLHTKGVHAMLASFRDLTGPISIHHNLFCSSRDRHPTLASGEKTRPGALVDYRNNVVYNLSGATNLGDAEINFINNYYRPGPNTREGNHPLATKCGTENQLSIFLRGNFFEGSPAFTNNNELAITFDRWVRDGYKRMSLDKIRAAGAFDTEWALPTTQSANEAFELVLRNAGASLHRDSADERLVKGVHDRTGRLIDSQDDVGGWPVLNSTKPPVDTDGDGMPDDWERAHGLNPNDPSDRNGDRDGDGYTNLEEYLNSLCPAAIR